MVRKWYLGADESNHGQFPEIFVGVFSRLIKDIEVQKKKSSGRVKKICKIRKGNDFFGRFVTEEYIQEIVDTRPWQHLVIPLEYKRALGLDYGLEPKEAVENIKVISICELVDFYQKNNLGEVFFDGFLHDKSLEKIERITGLSNVKITHEEHSDQQRRLVNLADRVAYLLYTYYTDERAGNHDRFKKNRIELEPSKLEMYQDLLLGHRVA